MNTNWNFLIKKNRINVFSLSLSILLYAGIPAGLQAVDFSGVPGTVLDHQPLTYAHPFTVTPAVFISDPEILVLPNGDYIAAHALASWGSNDKESGITTIFRSSDKGATWATNGIYNGILRGSFFLQNGALYFFGAKNNGSTNWPTAVIMESTNNGLTWTTAAFTALRGSATPVNPVVLSNRLWYSCDTEMVSATASSNLMVEASWIWKSGFSATQHPEWRSEGQEIGEGQVVASPELGGFSLSRVKQHAMAALSRINLATGVISFNPTNDFVSLPGGEKKFGAAYDPVSGLFFVLSNPVLPVHYNSGLALDMIRNTAAVLSSKDLRNWKVEKIFLYSSDVSRDGFGYLNFDFDDTNMVIAARTAFPVQAGSDPERGHDSNLLTFHRLNDFRHLSPNHYLTISGNQVLRYERTPDSKDDDAPLGSFVLGASFAGGALNTPDSLAQDANRDVYIHEAGGRILHFDAAGNFLNTTSAAPVGLQSAPLNVVQPADGGSTWVTSGSGDWFAATNWYYWNRPDTDEEIATFGSAITSASTMTVNEAYTLKGLRFLTGNSCTINGTGAFTLASAASNGTITIHQGAPEIQIPVVLNSDTDVQITAGSSLKLSSNLNLNQHALNVTGAGELTVANGAFLMNGGSITVGATVAFSNSSAVFNGTVNFLAANSFVPVAGKTCHILEGDIHAGMVTQVILPTLADGLSWDTSTLYSNGNVTVIRKVPATWMSQYGLPSDGSSDFIDSDGDKMDNYSEWKAGTNPTNALSVFTLSHNSAVSSNGFKLRWNSLTNRTYRLEGGTNLLASPAFRVIISGILGESGLTEFSDTNSSVTPAFFYRIVVE